MEIFAFPHIEKLRGNRRTEKKNTQEQNKIEGQALEQ